MFAQGRKQPPEGATTNLGTREETAAAAGRLTCELPARKLDDVRQKIDAECVARDIQQGKFGQQLDLRAGGSRRNSVALAG